MNCLFCNYKEIIAEKNLTFVIYDKFPVNKGHSLIIPKRHFSDFFESAQEEITAIYSLLHEVNI